MPGSTFCPQCGNKLEKTLKFCHNCGFNLSGLSSGKRFSQKSSRSVEPGPAQDPESELLAEPPDTPSDPGDQEDQDDQDADTSHRYPPKIDIRVMGKKLETVLEQIYKAEGYLTQKKQKISSTSGYYHEIDILAVKDNDKIAVECKNYLSPVGVEKIRAFSEKVRDLGNQWRGVFASYTSFTPDALECAKERHIELLSQDDIKERLYTALSSRASIQGDKIYIEDALPVNTGYPKVTHLQLKNKDTITVNRARLVFHPYMLYHYEIKKAWYEKKAQKSRVYKKDGIVIVDLLDNDVIIHDAIKEHEIINHKPVKSLSIGVDQDYQVIQLEPNYKSQAAQNSAKIYTIEKYASGEKLPFALKKSDVILDNGQPVYVPKWDILFEVSGKVYKREVLACSGETIFDPIVYCPHHKKLLGSKILLKKNIAACEECGDTFCIAHGTRCSDCNKWICKNHTITCSICKKPYCKDHISQGCKYCKEYVCSHCLVTCPTCNHTIGKNHMVTCDLCGKQTCSSCMPASGKLIKKHYCRDTCEQIVQQQQQKKGILGKIKGKIR
jgi:hypothetical protein